MNAMELYLTIKTMDLLLSMSTSLASLGLWILMGAYWVRSHRAMRRLEVKRNVLLDEMVKDHKKFVNELRSMGKEPWQE